LELGLGFWVQAAMQSGSWGSRVTFSTESEYPLRICYAVAASGFQVLRNRRVAKFPLQCLRSGGGRCVSGQITMVLMYYITSGVYISHAPKKKGVLK